MTQTQTQKVSKSYQTAIDRAMMRGDSDRVAELYAVPIQERPTWTPKRRKTRNA